MTKDIFALKNVLVRLTEKVERANRLQHMGGRIIAEDWSELYELTNEARTVLLAFDTKTN